jgi:hypothetical protein
MRATGGWAKKGKICKKVVATWMLDDYHKNFGETGEQPPQVSVQADRVQDMILEWTGNGAAA